VTQKFDGGKKIAADNLIFGSIIRGNCLLPPKIARTALCTIFTSYFFENWLHNFHQINGPMCGKLLCVQSRYVCKFKGHSRWKLSSVNLYTFIRPNLPWFQRFIFIIFLAKGRGKINLWLKAAIDSSSRASQFELGSDPDSVS
jgi:hypothetical protein